MFLSFLLVLSACLSVLTNPAHAGSVDLMVDSVWLEKGASPGQGQVVASVAPGDPFLIVASVKNIGDTSAVGYYLDVYYDTNYARGGPDNIAAGEMQLWYIGPLTAEAGSHTTRWIVDPENQIAEASESNNEKDLTFTAAQPQNATLALTPASGRVGTVVSVSGSYYQGTTCQLTAAPSNLFASSTCSISSGALTGSFTVDQNAPAGAYTVTAQTDLGQSDSAASTFTVSLTVSMTYAVTFYTDPASGTVSVDGVTKPSGAIGAGYSVGQRVHIVANQLIGYTFTSWEANGVAIEAPLSQDTYMTVSASGWVKAHYASPTTTQTVTVTSLVTQDSASVSTQTLAVTTTSTTTYVSTVKESIAGPTVTMTVSGPTVTETVPGPTATLTMTETVPASTVTSVVTSSIMQNVTVTVTQTMSAQTTTSKSIATPTIVGTTITVSQVTGSKGAVVVKGYLRDSKGQGLSGVQVRITVDGGYTGRVVTAPGGSFSYSGLAPTIKGVHVVTVWFDGTTQYVKSSASSSYRI